MPNLQKRENIFTNGMNCTYHHHDWSDCYEHDKRTTVIELYVVVEGIKSNCSPQREYTKNHVGGLRKQPTQVALRNRNMS